MIVTLAAETGIPIADLKNADYEDLASLRTYLMDQAERQRDGG